MKDELIKAFLQILPFDIEDITNIEPSAGDVIFVDVTNNKETQVYCISINKTEE